METYYQVPGFRGSDLENLRRFPLAARIYKSLSIQDWLNSVTSRSTYTATS